MNMQNLMMQAKKMQKDIEKAQKEIDSKIYEGKSQLVTVEMNGNNRLVSVDVNMELLDDKEMLEDMILLAVNDANDKIAKDKEQKFGQYGQMFNGLM